jgi:hypothetical protein
VDRSFVLSFERVIAQVADALDLLGGGNSADGMERLDAIEKSVLVSSTEFIDAADTYEHLLSWLRLQRASVLSDESQFGDARGIIERVLLSSQSFDSAGGETCKCEEYVSATVELASLSASEGDVTTGIQLLRDLLKGFRLEHISSKETIVSLIIARVEMWGQLLGYDDVLGGFQSEVNPQDRDILRRRGVNHWTHPIPLRGGVNFSFEQAFLANTSLLRVISPLNFSERLGVVAESCNIAVEWVASVEFSVAAREYLARFAMQSAELEIRMKNVGSFIQSMEVANELLGKLIERAPEHIDLLLSAVSSLASLANATLYSEIDEQDVNQLVYRYGFSCISSALAIIHSVRETSSVTQAVALSECTVANLAAIMHEMMGDVSVANRYRSLRVAIIGELLRLDPMNNLARRFRDNYRPIDFELDLTIVEEVSNWNWNVVPVS